MTRHRLKSNAVVAVVVSHLPDAGFGDRIIKLAQEVDFIIIVDNGDARHLQSTLLQPTSRFFELPLEVIFNHENLGIARALNIGIEHARALGASWIATFDQDSEIEEGYRASMMRALRTFPDQHQIALLAPLHIHRSLGYRERYRNANNDTAACLPREIPTTMTSGNFVPCTTYDLVGAYREDFIIDYVDHEFCFRCRKAGLRVIEVPEAILHHQLGKIGRERFGCITATVTHHNAMRRYFMTRNRLLVWRAYGLQNPQWAIKDMISSCKELFKILVFEEDKANKVFAILIGLMDAFRRALGWGSIRKYRSVFHDTME